MSIYESSVKRPIMTSLCFIAVAILGIFSLFRLPIDLYPDIDTNTIMVITTYSGASASDIEQNVTRPLENTLNSVEHLKHVTSKSKENVSIVTLEFEFGYDIDALTNDVRDKLDMVSNSLPDECNTPILFKFSTDMIPILMLSVQAGPSMPALYKILDEQVANPMARIDGVGTVSIAGAPKREVHVYVEPAKIESYGLTLEGIAQLIGADNRNIPGGTFDLGSQTYALRVEGEYKDPRELANLVVGSRNGSIIYLKDVARIDDSVEERVQEAYNNGVVGGMIIVQKQSGANSVAISKKVMESLPKFQKTLPSDVKLGIIVNTSDNITNTVNSLADTIRDALIFVSLVVFFFLGKWRATVIVLLTIPLSLVGSFIYLYATGSSLNIISMSALSIAVGMVVDDAIVVLENVMKHIERGSEPKQAAVHGTNEVALSVVASTLTMLAVFLPLTMVTGMTGVFFRELGWMVSIIMIVSTICALSITPMLCGNLLKDSKEEDESKFYKMVFKPINKALDALDNGYAKILDFAVHNKKVIVLGCVGMFVGSLFLGKFLGSDFFPTQDNSRIKVSLELPNGTGTDISRALAKKLQKRWTEEFPEIRVCNFRVGQASTDNLFATLQDNGSHIIEFNISLYSIGVRQDSVESKVPGHKALGLVTVCDSMRNELYKYTQFKKVNVALGGGGGMGGQAKVDFEILGHDFDKTDAIARELRDSLLKIPGCGEARISRSEYQPEYHVEFDREKLALNGLNLSTAASALRTRINGQIASYFREDGDEYNIRVMYAPEYRRTLEDIENITIYNAMGKGIRVKDLGKVVEGQNPPTIERKDRERINTVSAIVAGGGDMGKLVTEAQKKIDKMAIPAGISVDISGDFEDQQDSFRDLGVLAILIMILVFVVMAGEFESLTYPFINMMTLTFAVSGVIFALLISGETLNVMSLIGAIMLIGIVVKNGIVLIDYINLNRERGMKIIDAVVNGGKSRLRPVIMTTLTTILGMIPMAIGTGEGAEMWRPMGTAVIGGLTVSTILTLVFVPVMYCVFANTGERRRARKAKRKANNSLPESNS
ncbi:MAG: efflux RND transporter permease subunit [Paludibacteraceae bacterium]|nr:efflux RND transporter permease subunit [Candidatus Physcocola equi]MCQ2233826.1 efflux RND transporter permease subunit [Paludibacteraceae bacterium]